MKGWRALIQHLPEFGIEAFGIGVIVLVSAVATAFVVARLSALGPLADRALEATCIASTVLAMTYSPWGRRSGAHYNPAVTLTFLALRRVSLADALCYIAAQCMGGLVGIAGADLIAGAALRSPPVTWIVTQPGPTGAALAFAGEFAAAFILMSTVLAIGGIPSLIRFTGLFAAMLVFAFICFEAPLSGFSMNPARSLASALPAGQWHDYWIYALAPPAGMLAAALLNRALPWMPSSRCAKLQPSRRQRCIHCGFQPGGEHRCIRAAVLLIAGLMIAPAQAAVTGFDRIEITVRDPHAAARFYQEALGFRMEVPWHKADEATRLLLGAGAAEVTVAVLRLGDERVELDAFDPPGRPYPAGSHSPDLWFQHFAIVVADMRRAYARLHPWRLTAVTVGGPQVLPPADGSVAAFKFRDPDGHPLELLWFPAGQGRARWHRQRRRLFLGIDHSAIAVASTAASLRFYRDGLGMRQAYATLNRGPTQSRLDDVPAAVVSVTGLRPRGGDGAGIEMLQYQPPDGRSAPPAVAADIWKTRLVLTVDDLDGTLAGLPTGSGAVQTLSEGTRAVLIQDPDGHSLVLEQPATSGGSSRPPPTSPMLFHGACTRRPMESLHAAKCHSILRRPQRHAKLHQGG